VTLPFIPPLGHPFADFAVEDRVELVAWQPAAVDDHEVVPAGTKGRVFGHGVEQLWVAWDNGSTLSPVPGDVVKKVGQAMTEQTISVEAAQDIMWGSEKVATQEVSEHRWYRKQLIVYRRGAELWGFYYLDPASELQEDQDRFESDPVKTFPVAGREIVTTIYEPKENNAA
jgi:hypothetical protein